ncbi:hypothetical protein FQN54_006315 [Arachnomyces sp. PD_36]|nr:hypothetical protein FQN54_006315 [Arachnomyces sp. PD_36]
MSLTAQEEVDRLFNQKEKISSHPEDRRNDSNNSSEDEDGEEKHAGNEVDSDTDLPAGANNMRSKNPTYHIPTTVYDANTGPKGVIADAQAYERARKRSFRKTLYNVTGLESFKPPEEQQPVAAARKPASRGSSAESDVDDDDEEFMRKWRQSRMQELQEGKRRVSPNKRVYGRVDVVDANGYLDAVERVTADTVVLVCIYDPESNESAIVEDCLIPLARKYNTTHFVKLHESVADMDNITAPALLAYKGGDVFATIVEIANQLPNGRDCSTASLEDLLMQYRVL